MEYTVTNKKGRELCKLKLRNGATIYELKKAFREAKPQHKKYEPRRQRWTWNVAGEKRVLRGDDEQTLASVGVSPEYALIFKDLGAQISWRSVFIIEYLGPILIHLLFYLLPTLFYSAEDLAQAPEKTPFQTLCLWMVVMHFLKREFETLFVHRFSNASMGYYFLVKNCSHYWLLSGVFLAYPLYHPLYTQPIEFESLLYIGLPLFVLFEIGNFSAHITLRNLRPPGSKKKGIPRGGLFELVTCANYTYELAAWMVFAVCTQMVTAYFFWIVAFGQMQVWALKKHAGMKKLFGSKYPKVRNSMVPFVI
ncbi:MAG: hypothetical protein MHM6MM_004669 [Cercozoa sp. M6MM]